MPDPFRRVLPGDAFFLIRPTALEAGAMRIAAMPLSTLYGGAVADEFHLTVQRARGIAPEDWGPLLGDLHRALEGCTPFRLTAVSLWRYYSAFRASNALFWTMKATPQLLDLRSSLDDVLRKYEATLNPWPIDEWRPHTLALHNVPGEGGDLPLPPNLPRPAFTVSELWLSVYQPWGDFVEHPVVIFNPHNQNEESTS
jgi:hypothetical protein